MDIVEANAHRRPPANPTLRPRGTQTLAKLAGAAVLVPERASLN